MKYGIDKYRPPKDKKTMIWNFYIVLSAIIAIALLVFYFFPYFTYTSNDVGDKYQYSGYDLATANFYNIENYDEANADYQEKVFISELLEETKSKGLVNAVIWTSAFAMLSMIGALLFTILKNGKALELGLAILSLVLFISTSVIIKSICSTLNDTTDVAFIDGKFGIDYALYITIGLNILFVLVNILRKDRIKKLVKKGM